MAARGKAAALVGDYLLGSGKSCSLVAVLAAPGAYSNSTRLSARPAAGSSACARRAALPAPAATGAVGGARRALLRATGAPAPLLVKSRSFTTTNDDPSGGALSGGGTPDEDPPMDDQTSGGPGVVDSSTGVVPHVGSKTGRAPSGGETNALIPYVPPASNFVLIGDICPCGCGPCHYFRTGVIPTSTGVPAGGDYSTTNLCRVDLPSGGSTTGGDGASSGGQTHNGAPRCSVPSCPLPCCIALALGRGVPSGPSSVAEFRSIEFKFARMACQLNQQSDLQKRKDIEQQTTDEVLSRKKEQVKKLEEAVKEGEAATDENLKKKKAALEVLEKQSEERAKQSEERAKQSEERAQQAEERAQHAEQKQQHAEQKQQDAEQKQQDAEDKQREARRKQREAEAKKEEAERKSRFQRFVDWVRKHNGAVYSMGLGSVIIWIIVEGGRPISLEFLVNLVDLCKKTFLKSPIELVAEARRRTDGKPVESKVPVNIVLAIEGQAVKISEGEITKDELSLLKDSVSPRSTVDTDRKKSVDTDSKK